jgi:3-oxoacyl-[acyl-carrier-protein] synthase II
MKDVVITGIGLRSCLGNLDTSWAQLLLNRSGIAIAQPFRDLPPYPLGLIGTQPANLGELTTEIVNEAIADARLELPLPDCGVVIGSSRGAQSQWEAFLTDKNTPLNWWDSLPQVASVITAQQISTSGPVLSPMGACTTGIWAIAQGWELIQGGYCQRVIAGAIETPITPLTLIGFAQMNALATTGCYPFSVNRQGLVLGEAGAVFILENADLAYRRNAKIYGKILGYGLNCDAYHVSAPEPTGKYAIAAIKQCLQSTTKIDYIHAHGTATQLNDDREAKIIKTLFGNKIAVSSTKGATGHTLGASATLGIAFSLMAIQKQQLPPCVGLDRTNFDLNLITTATKSQINQVLCLSFGFGGQNGAIAISQ